MSTLTPTQADDRAALAALVQYQQRTPTAGLPVLDAARLQAQLALFPQAVLRPGHGAAWSEAQEASWDRVAALLVASQAAQPLAALQPARVLDTPAGAGPLLHDVAALLRDVERDEADELDLAVRWWQQARTVGLPVDPDFGECWRAIEWTAMHRHLVQLARQVQAGRRADPAAARLYGQIGKAGLRYGPLKPLLRLLEPVSDARVGAGYTF